MANQQANTKQALSGADDISECIASGMTLSDAGRYQTCCRATGYDEKWLTILDTKWWNLMQQRVEEEKLEVQRQLEVEKMEAADLEGQIEMVEFEYDWASSSDDETWVPDQEFANLTQPPINPRNAVSGWENHTDLDDLLGTNFWMTVTEERNLREVRPGDDPEDYMRNYWHRRRLLWHERADPLMLRGYGTLAQRVERRGLRRALGLPRVTWNQPLDEWIDEHENMRDDFLDSVARGEREPITMAQIGFQY